MPGLVLAAALAFTPADAALAHRTACTLVSQHTPRDAGTMAGLRAAHWLLDRASMTGADVRRDIFTADTPKGPRRFVNLYSEFSADPFGGWIVIVSHFDTKPGSGCPGANDGASTSGLLVALADVLVNRKEPRGNVMLVWTDAEECLESYSANDGLQGAKRAVAYIKSKGRDVTAVICLDMLGDSDLAITIPSNGSPALARIAEYAARSIGEEGLVSQSDVFVKDDHVPFLEAGMKAVDLIDFSYGPGNSWWHTPQDTRERISVQSLLKAGRLVCEMLNILTTARENGK